MTPFPMTSFPCDIISCDVTLPLRDVIHADRAIVAPTTGSCIPELEPAVYIY